MMLVIRAAKIALVAGFALPASLVVFGNATDYATNFEFVRHVLLMDTIFPSATIRYRAIIDSLRRRTGSSPDPLLSAYCPVAALASPCSAVAIALKASSRSVMPYRVFSASGAV